MEGKNTEISARIAEIIEKIGENPSSFAKRLGYSRAQTIYDILNGKSAPSYDFFNRFANAEFSAKINLQWLLAGRGNMLVSDGGIPLELTRSNPEKGENYVPPTAPMDAVHEPEAIPLAEIGKDMKSRPIPLVTEKAMAGFCNGHFSIAQEDVKEYYVIPKFRFCKVDFMIEVSGLSMYPHFNPGDVIACTILTDRKFLQWNKCHVIATREQGILVKRLMPSSHEGCITAVSENKEYPPFDIPMDEITGIALVVGSVSLE